MKILLVNKFHYLKGGSEKYYFELGELLKENGHEVAFFSMQNEKNVDTGCKEYFVEEIDLNSNNKFKALDVIYSKKNKEKMIEALEDFKPDVVHINNFQRQLSASIIEAIKEKNIPIVFTSHDLQAICPASAMLNHGKICEECLHKSKFHCVKNKCIKDSRLKSLLGSIELSYYARKKIYNQIDTIISPSHFVGEMIRKSGIRTNIMTIHNFIDFNQFASYETTDEDYAFYFGRLSIEKGIYNLIEAFSKQEHGKLYIAGDGPEKSKIIEFIHKRNLEDRIQLVGFLNQDQVKSYISKCSFVVVPSIWYENCPYSILETLALGKPVIGSQIGGIPELVIDGQNGYLYPYDDVETLRNRIQTLFEDKELRKQMGQTALTFAKEKYDKEPYYKELIQIYEKLVGESNVSKTNE